MFGRSTKLYPLFSGATLQTTSQLLSIRSPSTQILPCNRNHQFLLSPQFLFVSPSTASNPVASPLPGDHDTDVGWWNVTDPDANPVDSASLPLDVWSPLLPHDTGCMLSSFFFVLVRFTLRVAVDSVRNSHRALRV